MVEFANKMAGVDTSSEKKKKGGANKPQKFKKGADTREYALQQLQMYNRRTFKDCIEFNLYMLLEIVNEVVRTRFVYVSN